jgi:O-antigen/teichoic acid export membrane protein
MQRTNEPDKYFRTDHLETDLKSRSIRSGLVTTAAQAAKFILNLASNIILARLLAPKDFGLLAMVSTVTGFLYMFQDLGLSTATIQKDKITHAQVSTLFWINLGVSCSIMLFTAVVAPAIALFYKEPRLTLITIVLASGFIFSGLSVQHQALLKRQMRFTALATIEILSLIVSLATGIIAAWYGLGYWALVLMQLTPGITTLVGVWLICGWRPGLPVRQSGVGSMLAYGGNLTGFNIFNYFSRTLDNVLIGWYWGSQPLGLYAKAYQLLLLPIQQINSPIGSVALPTLCRLQAEPQRYKAYYKMGIRLTASFGMPLVALLFVVADKVILLILGYQWQDAIAIFQLLAPAAFIGTINGATGWVYSSLGRTGVAMAYSICSVLLFIPGILYAYQGSMLRLNDLWVTIARPMIASLGAAVALIAVESWLPDFNLAIDLFRDCLLYGLFYIYLWFAPPNGKESVLEMLRIAKNIRQK